MKHLASHLERLSVGSLPTDADFGEEVYDQQDTSDSNDGNSGEHTPGKDLAGLRWDKELDDEITGEEERQPARLNVQVEGVEEPGLTKEALRHLKEENYSHSMDAWLSERDDNLGYWMGSKAKRQSSDTHQK